MPTAEFDTAMPGAVIGIYPSEMQKHYIRFYLAILISFFSKYDTAHDFDLNVKLKSLVLIS